MKYNFDIDNRSLIEECVKGNHAALGIFYNRYANKMLGVVKRYVRDAQDAEDILHDGFVIAFTRLKSLRNPDSAEIWLASIMKNLALKFLQNQDVVTLLHEIPDVEASPEFEEFIDLKTLEALILKLPPGYQKVFRLAVLENKSHKEIAKILGIAPNSSSSQLFHAKVMMRRLITEYRKTGALISLAVLGLIMGITVWHYKADQKLALSGDLHNDAKTSQTPINGTKPDPNAPVAGHGNQQTVSFITKSVPENILASQSASAVQPIQLSDSTAHTECLLSSHGENSCENDTTHAADGRPYLSLDPQTWSNRDSGHSLEPYRASMNSSQWSLKIKSDVYISGSAYKPNNLRGVTGCSPHPDIDPEENNNNNLTRSRASDYSDLSHHNELPISASVLANYSLSNVVGLECGLSYTYLRTNFSIADALSSCRWHYLGLPLKLTFNNYSSSKFQLYASAGIQLDLPLYSSASNLQETPYFMLPKGRFSSYPVWSISGSYGAMLRITPHVGIFVEPTVKYNFTHKFELPNIWTDERFSFSLPVGLRFSF